MAAFKAAFNPELLLNKRYRVLADVTLFGTWLTAIFGTSHVSQSQLVRRVFTTVIFTLPFLFRIGTSVAHALLSLLVMPGQVLSYEGFVFRMIPKNPIVDFCREQNRNRVLAIKKKQQLFPNCEVVTLQTADDCSISAVHYKVARDANAIPTVVHFNGNAEFYEFADETLIASYLSSGINVFMFNYRGIGDSSWNGAWKAFFGSKLCQGMVLDGDAVVQYVHLHLGVPLSKILLHGQSMGGAIAAQVGALYPQLNVCNSRSFGKLTTVMAEIGPQYFGLSPDGRIGTIFKRVTPWIGSILGWELASCSAWSKISGFKWIEYTQGDHIISPRCSLLCSLVGESSPRMKQQAEATIEDKDGIRVMYIAALPNYDNHNRGYRQRELAAHKALVSQALQKSE